MFPFNGTNTERVYETLDQFGWNRVQIQNKIDTEKTNTLLKQLVNSDKELFIDDDEKPAVLIVTKKLWNSIKNLASIFENATEAGIDLSKIPTIIFDDEADHYSLDAYAKTKKKTFKKFNEAKIHTVENGESIEDISLKYTISIDNLKYLNDLEKLENVELQEGDKLLIEDPKLQLIDGLKD